MWSFCQKVLVHVGLILFGLVGGLVLVELVLQVAALTVGGNDDRVTGHLRGGSRVVCIGDSNTFGLWVGREAAYPRVLERLWNTRQRAAPIEVINLGAPGMNSSVVRARIREVLRSYTPDLVLVLIGVNDFWTAPMPTEEDSSRSGALFFGLWRTSRTFRLLFLLGRMMNPPRIDMLIDPKRGTIRARYGDSDIDLTWSGENRQADKDFALMLRDNLAAIAEQGRHAGTPIAFLTYVASKGVYGYVNALIREATVTVGAPLIDVASALKNLCESEGCRDLLFFDDHPQEAGHQAMAETILAALMKEGGVRGRDPAAAPPCGGTVCEAPCVGDCNCNGTVAINEIIYGVSNLLGRAPTPCSTCFDVSNDGKVRVEEIVQAMNNTVRGCVPYRPGGPPRIP
jgi:lysophospholipase L1-like esterase